MNTSAVYQGRGLIRDFLSGLDDALSPPLRPILWRVIGLGLLFSALLVWAAVATSGSVPGTGYHWLDTSLHWLAGMIIAISLFFAFPLLLTSLESLFLDEAAEKVELRAFPTDHPGHAMPFLPGLIAGLRFLGLTITLNILVLPLQVAGLVFPILNILVFWGLNGYLVGREYFEQVAMRHGTLRTAKTLRQRHRFYVFGAGLVGTALMVVPVVNLIAPLVTVAAMVRLERRVRQATTES